MKKLILLTVVVFCMFSCAGNNKISCLDYEHDLEQHEFYIYQIAKWNLELHQNKITVDDYERYLRHLHVNIDGDIIYRSFREQWKEK